MSRNVWKIFLLVLSLIFVACAGSSPARAAHTGTIKLGDGRSFTYTLETPASGTENMQYGKVVTALPLNTASNQDPHLYAHSAH